MATIKLTNSTDFDLAAAGRLSPGELQVVHLEALVDTGATTLVIPADVAELLRLPVRGERTVRYADGRTGTIPLVGSVLLEILGRTMTIDALVQAQGTTALIGQIPLEALDLLVDPQSREVRVNPRSPDLPMLDIMALQTRSAALTL
ncbi:MAG TPA: retroviral-like aspartic protease family protein [Polyangiaceae bacterium]|nr:retroviral-like aspartic protease family protein [Polyangiaceae bacterium]